MKFDVVAMATGTMTAMLVDLAADTTFAIPARQYVTAGEVAFDCEELVVHGVEITTGIGGIGAQNRTREDVIWFVHFGVTVVRCVPAPEDVEIQISAAVLDASGRMVLGDAGALLRAATSAWQRGALLPMCSDLVLGPIAWGTPNGMLIGTTLSIQAQM